MSSLWSEGFGLLPTGWSASLLPEGMSPVCVIGVQVVSSQVFHHSLGWMLALLCRFTDQHSSNVGAFHGREMSGGKTTGRLLGNESEDGAEMSEGEMAGKVTIVGGSDSGTVDGKMVGGKYNWVSLLLSSVMLW